MGFLHDLLLEGKTEQYEKDIKEAYSMGFRDGRLCPADLRPCKVDGAPALFHRFVENDRAILGINTFCNKDTANQMVEDFNKKNFFTNACNVEKLRSTMALIEWPDGRLCTVAVERVQFTDRED